MAPLLMSTPLRTIVAPETPRSALPRGACMVHTRVAQLQRPFRSLSSQRPILSRKSRRGSLVSLLVLHSTVQRCASRPALSRSTVNFTTTQAVDEADGRVRNDSPRHSGATVSIDFCVHYVVRAPCQKGCSRLQFHDRPWTGLSSTIWLDRASFQTARVAA